MSKMATTKAVQDFLNGLTPEKAMAILALFAPIVRGFERNQPKCSPANKQRHMSTLFSLLMYAGEDNEMYIMDQITQLFAHLPKVNNPGYVMTRSSVVLTSDPSDDERRHVEDPTQNVLLRRIRCIFNRLGVCSYWIGPGRESPDGGDTSMNHFLLRGIQGRIRDMILLKMKGERLQKTDVDLLEPTDVAALLGVSIPEALPPDEHDEPAEPVNDEHDKPVYFGEIDPAQKPYEQAAFVPVEGPPARVVYVPVDGQMMVSHLSNEVQRLNEQIAYLMKVNTDQSALLNQIGNSKEGVHSAYAPFPTWG